MISPGWVEHGGWGLLRGAGLGVLVVGGLVIPLGDGSGSGSWGVWGLASHEGTDGSFDALCIEG